MVTPPKSGCWCSIFQALPAFDSVRMTLTSRTTRHNTSKKKKKKATKRCSFSGELTTWSCSPSDERAAMLKHELERSPPLWYAVCTLLFFCSLCLTRTGHPEIPQISTAASSAGLHTGQAAGREYATSLPSLLCARASNRALGMCCNLVECQIALLNWAFLEFSGDRPVGDETRAPKGGNVRRDYFSW